MPAHHVLTRVQLIPLPRSEVFPFFADARNLERITPPWLRFRIVTPGDLPTTPGTLIDYRLSLAGVPFGWRTRIEAVEPGRSFVDRQLVGPYRLWHHQHSFEDAPGPSGPAAWTRMTDRVDYELPLGPLGSIAHAVFVRHALGRIFDHRREAIARLLGPAGAVTSAGR